MNILRAKSDRIYLYALIEWILSKNIDEGQWFAVSWKVRKRRKLKSYKLLRHRQWECENCGSVTDIELKRSGHKICISNHFGSNCFSVES